MKHHDFRSGQVRNQQAMRDLDQFAWAPRTMVNWPSLIVGTAVSALLLGFLFALFVIGAK